MNEIYSSRHQLQAVQTRLTYFANLAFNPDRIFDEIERLKQIEEVLIYRVESEEKKRS